MHKIMVKIFEKFRKNNPKERFFGIIYIFSIFSIFCYNIIHIDSSRREKLTIEKINAILTNEKKNVKTKKNNSKGLAKTSLCPTKKNT